MKTRNKMFVAGMSLMMLFGTISTVAAANVVNGTQYQRVTHVDIPGNGDTKYNMNYGSKKVTTGGFGSIKKIRSDAWLGNYGYLVDSSKKQISKECGISTTVKHVTEVGESKGSIYYLAMASSSLEPSNSCDTTCDFSADILY